MKVLLVDDEIFTIRMLQNLIPWRELGLELIGYAHDGESAYEKVLRETPDIIISDIKMTGMDGLEFLKKVTSLNAGIKMILMSAYADFSYVKEGIRLGCSDYILKPVDESELEQALRKLMIEIQGEKEQKKVISKSIRQLDKLNLYQYMKTNCGMNKILKSDSKYRLSLQEYAVFIMQVSSSTIDEYNDSTNLEMGQEGYISHMLEPILGEWCAKFTIFDYEEGCWTIILENFGAMRREEIARNLISVMQDRMGIRITICFSSIGSGLGELPSLYEEVKNLNKYRFYMGEEEILGYGYNCSKEELNQVRDIGMAKESEKPLSYSKPVMKSLNMIEQNYNQNLSLEEICTEIAVSKNYFCYLFKRETGVSLWNYLTTVRIQHAKQLLETTDLRSYEIAFQVGYDNPSYFSKLFKKYENMTPNEYRERKK